MDLKKIFKVYIVSAIIFIFLFLLALNISINLLKNEIKSYLDSNEFEKKIYSYTLKSITTFAETEPNENDKIILKDNLKKIFDNYKDIIPNSEE